LVATLRPVRDRGQPRIRLAPLRRMQRRPSRRRAPSLASWHRTPMRMPPRRWRLLWRRQA